MICFKHRQSAEKWEFATTPLYSPNTHMTSVTWVDADAG